MPVLRPGSVVEHAAAVLIRDLLGDYRSLLKLLDRRVETIDGLLGPLEVAVRALRLLLGTISLTFVLVTLSDRLLHERGGPVEGVH